jgi:hypothetical protein
LWSSTVRLLGLYKSKLGAVPLASATVLRTRRGKPYTKDRLTRDVRAVLRKAGIPDELRLSDLRRTASKERAEAGASEAELAAGGGWSIERGAAILDVYNPRTYEMAASAQAKRRNKTRPKV